MKNLFTSGKEIAMHRRITNYFLIVVLIMGSLALFSFFNMNYYNDRNRDIINNHIILNRISSKIKQAVKDLYNYVYMPVSKNDINLFFSSIDDIQNNINQIKLLTTNPDELILIENIRNKLISCREEADQLVKANYNFKTQEVTDHMDEINKISMYIDEDIKELVAFLLSHNEKLYLDAVRNTGYIQTISILTIIGTVILGSLFALGLSRSITTPLNGFAALAEKISTGDFNVELSYSRYIEVNRLIKVFKKMSADIQSYIAEIQMKAFFEHKLKEQELENLRMTNNLREARLDALQAQINPHFLFNTLNIISRKAILEEANGTSDLINSLAKLMRYNFSKLDTVVELKNELDNVNEYLSIQEARFGKRIAVKVSVEESLLSIKIPCLTIQPLVENAFRHGVENMEQGGQITIHGVRIDDIARITIADNGAGMKPELIRRILSDGRPYKTTNDGGIGIQNVKERLELFYNRNLLFDIQSVLGAGTNVILDIPINHGEENEHVQIADC